MIRIAGVNIPENKHILISLTYIFGIGINISKIICDNCKIEYQKKAKDLDLVIIDKIREEVSKYLIEGDLRRLKFLNIKRLMDINSYRGIRHKKNLPTRGQRTKTNAKTRKKFKIN